MNFSGLSGDILDIVGPGDPQAGTDSMTLSWYLFQTFIGSVVSEAFDQVSVSLQAWSSY